jgi:hypothetical protein
MGVVWSSSLLGPSLLLGEPRPGIAANPDAALLLAPGGVTPAIRLSARELDQAGAVIFTSNGDSSRDHPSPAQDLPAHQSPIELGTPLEGNLVDDPFAESFLRAWGYPTSTRFRGFDFGRISNSLLLGVLDAAGSVPAGSSLASSPAPASTTTSTNQETGGPNLPTLSAFTQLLAPVHPGSATPPGSSPAATNQAAAANAFRLPLDFEANLGQSDPQVRFLTRGPGYTLFLTATETVMVLPKPVTPPAMATATAAGSSAPEASVLRMQLVGANPNAVVVGQQELPGKSNYFLGNDPSRWVTNVPHYGRVTYQDIYPGIDLVYYGSQQRQLEYDWVVAPGADPGAIRLAYQGAEGLRLDAAGNLLVATGSGEVTQQAPLIYQEVRGVRQSITGHFVLQGAGQVGLRLDGYDGTRPLVIDPVVSYATYLGGSGSDQALAIAVDGSGNSYVTGRITSTNFPTANPLYPTYRGGPTDAFVSKLSADGSMLLYSTYLGGGSGGGSGADVGYGIAVDAAGNAYVTGNTQSQEFPTFHPYQANLARINGSNAFLTKLSADGSALLYSSYLGGTGTGDVGQAVAVDGNGRAYVTGYTRSSDFPTRNPLQQNKIGFQDAFVAKFDPSQSGFSSLIYSTYYGGNSVSGNGIAVDANGDAFVTGTTGSTVLRTTANAYQAQIRGFNNNAFLAEFNPSDSDLLYGSFFGGTGTVGATEGDVAYGIALDSAGNAYITGSTTSSDFPTQGNPVQPTYGGGQHNAFVAKFDTTQASGPDTLLYSTYLGGGGDDIGRAIAVDATGDAYVTGSTSSSGPTPFPTTPDALQPALGGDFATNMFVTEVNVVGSELVYSSYFGGSGDDEGQGIAVDNSGDVYIAGLASSTGLSTPNAFQTLLNGSQNALMLLINVPQISVVNVIPTAESTETYRNAEPSIAVSPGQPQNMVISAIGDPAVGNPYFTSANGGARWDHFAFHTYKGADDFVGWSPSGKAYRTALDDATVNLAVTVGASPNPQVNDPANKFMMIPNSQVPDAIGGDQPQLVVTNVGGSDRVYIGLKDIKQTKPPYNPTGTGNGKTATVWYSTNPGVANPNWQSVVIEPMVPAGGADLAIRVAANGNKVYAVFQRLQAAMGMNWQGDLAIVRDDNGGANNFTDLNATVTNGVVFPGKQGTTLGQERIADTSVSIAVDPNNANKVFVAWADVNANGNPQIHVSLSTDGGATWNVKFNAPANTRTGLPQLAVAQNGTVGLLYTKATDAPQMGNLETHFLKSANDFGTTKDVMLATFPDNEFPMPTQPYIGDYEGLVAVGNTFFGTFSASNVPDIKRFPRGVFYQRSFKEKGVVKSNQNVLGADTLDNGQGQMQPISIDPFFFKVPG